MLKITPMKAVDRITHHKGLKAAFLVIAIAEVNSNHHHCRSIKQLTTMLTTIL